MAAQILATKRVEKPWGRHSLWPGFADPAVDAAPVGEIWFDGGDDADLLIKYLFTSEKLSVQNHPSDAEAHRRGLPRGKDECWLILAAEPESTIAIGPRKPVSAEQLRAAALDGSIEALLDWKRVRAGDFFYSHSGVIHAIGAGITLIEVQQNSDTTYRLYDYGRPRELHLEDGVAVAELTPYVAPSAPGAVAPGRVILVEGPKFVLERWDAGSREVALAAGQQGWLVPVAGAGTVGGIAFEAGECVLLSGVETVAVHAGGDVLFAYSGSSRLR
ncbi:MAG: class I mannose-6-phosphate isomerase [Sphingomonas sp.]|uniref:class I mannose-6-phosphate isomerase n=1 Tax=Sphingomonas sp. TaxID=28214 RepID=UPI0017C18F6D|nr:class I mannose-6-phosphate isomerase [Sphingomonas sp.]